MEWRPVTKVGSCFECERELFTTTAMPPDMEILTNALCVNNGDLEMEMVCMPLPLIGKQECLDSFLNTHPDWQIGS